MREATIRLTINEADAGNWLLQAHELNVHPERTVRDVVQQITEQLNDADARAAIAVFVVGVADSDAARAAFPVNVRFEFTNGGRGWEARADLDAWLLLTLSLVAEHGAEHGPITSDRNRAATRDELIDAVEKHATDHYTDGGWDYIAEAYDRDELAELIGDADTVEAAIAKAAEVAELLAER